jgi:hypothetical protein
MEGDVILFRLQGVRLCPACLILRPAAEMTEAGTCRYCAPSAGEAPAREEASAADAGDDQREDLSRPEPA